MEPEQAMPQGQPPSPQGKQPSAEQIVSVVGEGLMALGQMLEGKPELQQKISGLIKGLQSIIAEAVGEPSPEEQAPQPAGAPAAMQQGGNRNAVPA